MCFTTLGFHLASTYRTVDATYCIFIYNTVLWNTELTIGQQNSGASQICILISFSWAHTCLIKPPSPPSVQPTTVCLLSINSSSVNSHLLSPSPICSAGSGPIQLWQFLLELLTDKSCQSFISWTGDGWEFKLSDPDEVRGRDTTGHWHTCWEVLSS